MTTRAKFYVSARNTVANNASYNEDGSPMTWTTVTLQAAYSPDPSTENHRFWKASPNGNATLTSKSFDTDVMAPGSFWYIDVKPYPDDSAREDGWKLTKLEQSKGSNTLTVTLSGPQYQDQITVGIDNQGVWPLFMNKLGQMYDVKLIPTTKEGQG